MSSALNKMCQNSSSCEESLNNAYVNQQQANFVSSNSGCLSDASSLMQCSSSTPAVVLSTNLNLVSDRSTIADRGSQIGVGVGVHNTASSHQIS